MSSTPRTRRAPIALTGAALAAALGASLTFSLPASADLGDQKAKVGKQLAATRDKLDAAKDDLADTSAALKAAYADVSATRGRLPAAQNAVALARTNAALAQQRNQQAIADLALAKAAEAEAASDLADTTTKLTRTRSQVAGFAAQMYQEQGLGSLAAQFSATDAQDLADRMSMADNVADIQAQALSTLSASAADLAGKQARLTATRRQVADAQAATAVAAASAQAAQVQAEQAQAELESLLATQQAAAASLDQESAKEKARLDALTAQSDGLRARLAVIARQQKAEADAAAAAAAAAQNHGSGTNDSPSISNPPPTSGGFLSAPSSGWISSEFGMRWHPILHYWRLHSGRDYAAACGTPIYAAAPGVVVSAGWGGGYGNQVVLSHGVQRGVSLATTYNHMSQIVAYGGSIARGQLVGYVGTTGLSTGCHLHFETRENGVPVDPRRWL